ncbi:MAG: phenylalanine--tRNA ligase subunit beta [Clostridia bacterium]|nr:phenylalanine--tRNA ligase subunit beta [Clostridia bacterium]
MYISINWIKDFVDLNGIDVDDLIKRFALSTAEVEGVQKHGDNLSGIIVGKIMKVEEIAESKKLHKLDVFDGKENVQVMCGAPNVREGMLVPFAPVGSVVQGINIGKATLAGYDSFGMCMSEKELGISDDHAGLMELYDVEPGTAIKDIMDIDDIVFEVDNKSLTNRPDLWGHYGIAREIAAITGRELKALEVEDLEKYSNLAKLNINIEDKEKCLRYTSMAVENISKHVSPINMRIRLYYTGSRGINLLADLTNYIMLELGQPMHAFDKSLISNINVKSLVEDTEFVTLDSNKRILPKDSLVICNDNTPVAIAGIMGGENTEIKDSTNSLFLESANFDPTAIRKTAIKLGLRTDASARYEKTLDPELTVLAIARFIKLLKDIDENVQVVSALTDVYAKKYPHIQIEITYDYIIKRIGENIPQEKMVSILKSLGFGVQETGSTMLVDVPSYRATKDVSIKADLVEEIARIYGYDNITPQTKNMELEIVRQDEEKTNDYVIKDLLAEKYNMSEVHSYVWYDTKKNKELNIKTEDNIKIINSIDAENSTLRSTMIPTLLCMLEKNIKYMSDVSIFEIGKVWSYPVKNKNCIENKNLGIILASKKKSEEELLNTALQSVHNIVTLTKNVQVTFKDMQDFTKHNWLNPVNSSSIFAQDRNIGYISILNLGIKNAIDKKLNCVLVEIYLDELNSLEKVQRKAQDVSKYQTVTFDLSFITSNTTKFEVLKNIIENTKTEYLASYELVDIFEDSEKLKDKKSVTIRFVLSSDEHTLTSEEIAKDRESILKAFEANEILIRE